MKNLLRVAIFFAAVGCSASHAVDSILPKFSDYPAEVYSGKLKLPTYYKKMGDVWRDDMGKMVSSPMINFAGKYHIGIHSCGVGCRYYTLSNLVNGSDSDALDMFSNDADRPQKTSDGRFYITDLIGRAGSVMLVAQYHIEQSGALKEECRERIFYLTDDGRKIKSITKTINRCEKFQ